MQNDRDLVEVVYSRIMRHFIDGAQADLDRAHAERLFEGLARVVERR